MSAHRMTAEVFLAAFRTLSKKERDIFLAKLIKNKRLREDFLDIAIAESRKNNKGRSFHKFRNAHEE